MRLVHLLFLCLQIFPLSTTAFGAEHLYLQRGAERIEIQPLAETATALELYAALQQHDHPLTPAPGSALIWLHRADPSCGTGALSLALLLNGAREAAGELELRLTGLPKSAFLILSDDSGELKSCTTESGVWSGAWRWYPRGVDGAIIGGLEHESWRLGLKILKSEGIDRLLLLSQEGDAAAQLEIALDSSSLALERSTTPLPTSMAQAAQPNSPSADRHRDWVRVYRHDFRDLKDVTVYESWPARNSQLSPSDRQNNLLQQPTLKANVQIVEDPAAEDGFAVALYTRKSDYKTKEGIRHGWSNGRLGIHTQNHPVPVRVRARLRFTAAVKTKSVAMWWPSVNGWPWEVDFAEVFGGKSLSDYWGSRQIVSQRWHADINGDGKAREQLIKNLPLDSTQYHIYDLFIRPDRMWIEIDGELRYETRDRRYIPNTAGHFTAGQAMTHQRDAEDRTDDASYYDWLEIYRPAR